MENETFDIREFAGQVCKSLGSTWSVKELTPTQIEYGPSSTYTDITDSITHAKIGFHRVWNKKTHVSVSGSFPDRDADGKVFLVFAL